MSPTGRGLPVFVCQCVWLRVALFFVVWGGLHLGRLLTAELIRVLGVVGSGRFDGRSSRSKGNFQLIWFYTWFRFHGRNVKRSQLNHRVKVGKVGKVFW